MKSLNNRISSIKISGYVFRWYKFSLIIYPRELIISMILLFLLIILIIFSVMFGKLTISFSEFIAIFFGENHSSIKERIIFQIRLPRTLTAVCVGIALGISGSIFQSVSRNVLGSPDVIGFTTGAATGAIAQIILFDNHSLSIAIAAISGGIFTALIVSILSIKAGVISGYRLILIGIGVGSLLSALNGLLLVKGNLDNAIIANLWLSGSLHARTWLHVTPLFIGIIVLLPFILFSVKKLTIIEMGDAIASQLGINIHSVKIKMIFLAVVLVALATAAAGPIAFIALAAPQLVVRLTRTMNRPIINAALMGAVLMLLADLTTQLLSFKMMIPIGRMTGILGGIYLIWLLMNSKRI